MNKPTVIVFALLVFLVTACGASATAIPATEPPAPASIPTDTLVPTIEPSATLALPIYTPIPAASDTPAAAATVSFANDVMPILQSRCFNCHGGDDVKEGLSFASYDTLMAGSINGPVLIPGDAANSLLIQQIQNGKMPKRGPKLTPDQLQILIDWILAGALNN
jgi:mono/diheme cytochrome c family protein